MTTCPRCGSPEVEEQTNYAKETGRTWWVCGTYQTRDFPPHNSELCLERDEKLQTMRERDEACNDPDHAAINAERGESRGLRQAWVALDDKRQELEQELRTARNLADSAMWEADRLRSKLEKLERERDEAQRLLAAAKESLNAIRLLAAAKESLNAIHVEVGGWIAAMMKEGK